MRFITLLFFQLTVIIADDRVENIRRVSEVAKLMCDAGLIVITSFMLARYIAPFLK